MKTTGFDCNDLVLNCFISVCTGLPESWTGVTTETVFPVSHGATLAVSCQEECYTNTGSDEITCNTDLFEDFESMKRPQCELGKLI